MSVFRHRHRHPYSSFLGVIFQSSPVFSSFGLCSGFRFFFLDGYIYFSSIFVPPPISLWGLIPRADPQPERSATERQHFPPFLRQSRPFTPFPPAVNWKDIRRIHFALEAVKLLDFSSCCLPPYYLAFLNKPHFFVRGQAEVLHAQTSFSSILLSRQIGSATKMGPRKRLMTAVSSPSSSLPLPPHQALHHRFYLWN